VSVGPPKDLGGGFLFSFFFFFFFFFFLVTDEDDRDAPPIWNYAEGTWVLSHRAARRACILWSRYIATNRREYSPAR